MITSCMYGDESIATDAGDGCRPGCAVPTRRRLSVCIARACVAALDVASVRLQMRWSGHWPGRDALGGLSGVAPGCHDERFMLIYLSAGGADIAVGGPANTGRDVR